MQRDVAKLTDREFDVVIVGGGIFGACAAWDAVLRGLSVALVERADFGGGTSANSFKVVHGGIRYLQHADLIRLRASCRERSALLRIAPHLVQPLPILVPTYGHGRSGKIFLGAGMLLYDLLTLDRNRGIKDKRRRIPWSGFLNRRQVLELFPDVQQQGLTGGAVFNDGQMYNPTRLVLAFVQSAVATGAVAANYVEAIGFERSDDEIRGVVARDILTGDTFTLRSKVVLNAAGPWAEKVLNDCTGNGLNPKGVYSRDTCFVIARRFAGPYALAVAGQTKDPDAVLGRAARHLFVVPWRNYTLIGVWHVVYDKGPNNITVDERELQSFIDEINWAYPSLKLTPGDISIWNAGLVPFGENAPDAVNLSYGKRSRLVDHAREHGIKGLVTLIGVRYTMARGDAAIAMDLVSRKLGKGFRRPPTHRIPLHGGGIEDFDAFVDDVSRNQKASLQTDVTRALLHNYGSAYQDVLYLAEADPSLAVTMSDSMVLKAEVINAIRNEMAVKLSDIVFRRTDLATGGNPGEQVLRDCAGIAASELGWTSDRMEREFQSVLAHFIKFNGTSRSS